MGRAKKSFSVDIYVDKEAERSSARLLQAELFDRKGGETVPESISEGSLVVRPQVDGKPTPDCLEITEMSYADGKVTFRAAVREEFIKKHDFLTSIGEPICYEVEARPKNAKGKFKGKPEPVVRLLNVKIKVASIHWNWWVVAPDYLRKELPGDAEADKLIRLDPDGASGFRLELWVREFNQDTAQFEDKHGAHDFTHWIEPREGELTQAEVSMRPLPWESEDPNQNFTNWWSVRRLYGAPGEVALPYDGILRVNAYPKGSIKRRPATYPFMVGDEPKVATRDIGLRLEQFEFELCEIGGKKPGEVPSLAAAKEEIPGEGYKLTLKLFDGEREAPGIRVRVKFPEEGEGGRGPLGKILKGGGEEMVTREDGTFDFFYKPEALDLRAEDLESMRDLEERFEIVARRYECGEGHVAGERNRDRVEKPGGAKEPSLRIALAPELKLQFYKKPFIFDDSAEEKEPAPYVIDLKKELPGVDRERIEEIIRRGGELHLRAGIRCEAVDGVKAILDGSWSVWEGVGEEPGKNDRWLDEERKEVCVLKFPETGHPEGPVGEALEFEMKGGFRMIRPIEAQMARIGDRADKTDDALATEGRRIAAKAKIFVESCVEKIGERDEEKLDEEAEQFIETIATVPFFLWNTKLSKDALEVSFDLYERAFRCFRDNATGAFLDIQSFAPIGTLVGKYVGAAGDKMPTGHIARLLGEYLENGKESAMALAGELARDLPVKAGVNTEKLVEEGVATLAASLRSLESNAGAARTALTGKMEAQGALARRIAPLREAKETQEKVLGKLEKGLPGVKKAARDAKADLQKTAGTITELREGLGRVAKSKERESKALQGHEKRAARLMETEMAAEDEAATLATELEASTAETNAAMVKRDEARRKLDGLKKVHDELMVAALDAKSLAEAKTAELERIKTTLVNLRNAREAAIGRQESLEQKLADRKLAAVAAEKDAGAATMRAEEASERVAEKRKGREALEETRKRIAGEFEGFATAERTAKAALEKVTSRLSELKSESPPNQQEIRGAEKERVELSRDYDRARDELADYRVKAERSQRAIGDADKTVAAFVEKEEEAIRFADEVNEAFAKAKQLREEQSGFLDLNVSEIERLKGEVASLEVKEGAATREKGEADSDLSVKGDAVKGSDGWIEVAKGKFLEAEGDWKELEATRSALEARHGKAARNLERARAESEAAKRAVDGSLEELAKLRAEEEEMHGREKEEAMEEEDASGSSDREAEALRYHEASIESTRRSLEETEAELAPLEEELPRVVEGWKEARTAERGASESLSRKVLESRNLEQWNEKRAGLEGGLEGIFQAKNDEGFESIARKFEELSSSIPADERRVMIEGQVRGLLDERKKEIEQWKGALEGLSEGEKDVVDADGLIASWEEYHALEEEATVNRLAEISEAQWVALDKRITAGLRGGDADLAGALEEMRAEGPPPGSDPFHEERAKEWERVGGWIDHAAGWIRNGRVSVSWMLDWFVPDFVSSFFLKVVLASFVEALSWVHAALGWFADRVVDAVSQPGFCGGSALPKELRLKGRRYIQEKNLCHSDFFSFEPWAEMGLLEELKPGQLKPEGALDRWREAEGRGHAEGAMKGGEEYCEAQRHRAVEMFESLCLRALNPRRLDEYAPLENLRQRRPVTGLLENLTKGVDDYWKVYSSADGEQGAPAEGVRGLSERGGMKAEEWDGVFGWLGWSLSWAIRTGALVALPFRGGASPEALSDGGTIEEACAPLRTVCASVFTYPGILAYQHDVVLAEALAYQAFFEGYELPGTGTRGDDDEGAAPASGENREEQ